MNATSANSNENPFQLLVAEDDPDHFILFRRALRKFPHPLDIQVARDGLEALNMLSGGDLEPRLVLLDINMPKLSGLEVLKSIKADEALSHIPVVILTTSVREKERRLSLACGADAFVTKHVNFKVFREMLNALILSYVGGEGGPPEFGGEVCS